MYTLKQVYTQTSIYIHSFLQKNDVKFEDFVSYTVIHFFYVSYNTASQVDENHFNYFPSARRCAAHTVLTVHFNPRAVLVLLDMCGISGVHGAVASVTIKTSGENGPFTDSLLALNLHIYKAKQTYTLLIITCTFY